MPLWPEIESPNQPMVHVEWSNMGNALAAADSSGRVSVYVQGYALNQMVLARSSQADPDDEMHALVGLFWLPVFPQQQKVIWSASLSALFNAETIRSRVFIGQHDGTERTLTTVFLTISWPGRTIRSTANRLFSASVGTARCVCCLSNVT